MSILCSVGIHLYKKTKKEVNGYQVIKTYTCSCGRKRVDVLHHIGGRICQTWSWYYDYNGGFLKETDPETINIDQ